MTKKTKIPEVMIRAKEQTRRKLKIWSAQHGITYDEAINKLLEIAQKGANK